MKIGIVCPYTWDVPGGVQQHIRDLAEALIELGHTVSVISPADEDTPLPDYVVSACRAVPVPYNGSVARLAFGFLSASRVRRWLREGNFDVLHVHEPAAPSLSLLACWIATGPIVATVHTANPKSRAMHAFEPILASALEKINGRIAVSEAARTTLVEHLGGDAVLIPNGVATRRYRAAEPLPGWPGDGGAIGFLGRMDEPRKGLAVLLKAFETLGTDGTGSGCSSPARVIRRMRSSGCPSHCATGLSCSGRSASRTRCACCRIVQAAGEADDGDGAIAQAVELAQAARLKEGGHQEEIAAGFDAVGEGGIETDLDGALAGKALGQKAVAALEFAPAAAEQNELHVGGEHLLQGAQLNVHALLLGQASHRAEEGDLGADGQAQFLLQLHFVGGFALQIAGAVTVEEVRIALRFPLVIIHAVENSHQGVLPPAQYAVQAAAVLLGGDFPGVAGADGGDAVGVSDARLETIHAAVEFHAGHAEEFGGQVGQGKFGGGKIALKGHVMNGQADRRRRSPAAAAAFVGHEGRGQGGLPIMQVKHLGPPRQSSGRG